VKEAFIFGFVDDKTSFHFPAKIFSLLAIPFGVSRTKYPLGGFAASH
jgi:hypothetical protein